ncbi:MAG: VOC family protein [Proteobacteria bacterium]|nr:VOC family protein [Pseudomonadota bacterium]
MPAITPCLWFDREAEEAVKFYLSVFKTGKIVETSYYGENGHMPAGTVLVVTFELNGARFQALNGGPHFKFNEAISLSVDCKNQEEVDYFWDKLTAGGGAPSQCGWLKDKYGVSWQIVPDIMPRLLQDPDRAKVNRAMQAMMKMTKIVIADIEAAARG